MAINIERLRAVMRGEHTLKNGVTGVSDVTSATELRPKPPELRQLRPLRQNLVKVEKDSSGGVIQGASRVHACECGAEGIIAEGWFLHDQSRARWFCGGCYRGRDKTCANYRWWTFINMLNFSQVFNRLAGF